jgi:hypothetical protein
LTFENIVRSPMPTARATSTSSLESIVKVTRPSTSFGAIPASSMARLTASQASASSETPELLLYFERQASQIGRGGWRSLPRPAQRWIGSLPLPTCSHHQGLSGPSGGWIRVGLPMLLVGAREIGHGIVARIPGSRVAESDEMAGSR